MLESSLDLSADGRIELYKDRMGSGMKGELHLTGLSLTAVPPSLASLHGMNNLKELYLAHNKLSTLPEHVTQLCSLEKLDLTSNVLAELPPAIGSLARLYGLRPCEWMVRSVRDPNKTEQRGRSTPSLCGYAISCRDFATYAVGAALSADVARPAPGPPRRQQFLLGGAKQPPPAPPISPDQPLHMPRLESLSPG